MYRKFDISIYRKFDISIYRKLDISIYRNDDISLNFDTISKTIRDPSESYPIKTYVQYSSRSEFAGLEIKLPSCFLKKKTK